MKILILSEYLHPQTSGITIRIEYYIKYLRKFGHEVIVYGPKDCPTANRTLFSIPCYFFNKDMRICFPSLQLYRDILFGNYQMVHIVGPNIFLFTIFIYLLCLLMKINICTSYHTNAYEFVRLYIKNPYVFQLMTNYGYYTNYYPTIRLKIPILHPENYTDLKILCNNFNKGNVLSTGIDTQLFSFSKNFLRNKLIYIGRIAPEKNLFRLIDLFSLIQSDYTLDIVGFGSVETQLKDYVRKKNIEHIRFIGRIPYDQLYKYYQSGHAFLCTSLHESYGFTLLESLSCGTPIIYPKCEVFRKLYQKDFPQLEFDVDDDEQFLNALTYVQENTDELRELSRKYAEKYSWEKSTEDLLDIYQHISLSNK
ncbi:unnamed protein product [Adineta ricciae]|uniref:Glycosyltransferase n=1 Tax=Adineta ricciae TaxID=249248 RepID=A0A814WWM1_ADIRI|nr:unnamed protein product [Adineta ricciae]CAF1489869.1 unnamed protein product [Adineta ricciae]